ncbi:uncharacterized protein LOC135378904 isoform X2 [Ornithodoros turicata]|uniref:uncharacterized protein LOC135378904 isoform X2 n=1 Tax=Ornithodoros turicata TaxID=34597 RepID=UPI003139E871
MKDGSHSKGEAHPSKAQHMPRTIGIAWFHDWYSYKLHLYRYFFKLFPAIREVWDGQRQKHVAASYGSPVALAGVGRADSPGFSTGCF